MAYLGKKAWLELLDQNWLLALVIYLRNRTIRSECAAATCQSIISPQHPSGFSYGSPFSTSMTTPMPFFLSGLLAIALWLSPISIPNASSAYAAHLGVLPGLGSTFAGETPDLGVEAGQLSSCPATLNCVVSQNADESHAIAPIAYQGDRQQVQEALIKVLAVVPRTEIVIQTEDYVRAKSTSRLMGFVDDTEFYFPTDESVIHLRAAARLGESDLGVNRRRLEQIRLALQDLGV